MMLKQGFTLIEMIVSIAISSLISVVLFTILIQVQKSAQFVASDVSVGVQLITGYERLQKDFTGMFWPQFRPSKTAKSQEKSQDHVDTGKQNKSSNGEKSKSSNEESSKTRQGESNKVGHGELVEPSIVINKIIFSQNTRFNELEILKECSFITCNPLEVYGQAKARIARVIYSLEQEPNSQAGAFSLYRQEGASLDYLQVKNDAPKFALISGIRLLNLSYFYQDQQSKNHEPELIKKQDLELSYVSQQGQEVAENEQNLAGRVPSYVKLNLSLWTSPEQKDFQDFEFWFYINNLALDEPVDEQKK